MTTDQVISPASRRVLTPQIQFELPHPPFRDASGVMANWLRGLNGKWSRIGPLGCDRPLNHQCQIKDAFFPLDLTWDQLEMSNSFQDLWGHWRSIDGIWIALKGPAPRDFFNEIEENETNQIVPLGRCPVTSLPLDSGGSPPI